MTLKHTLFLIPALALAACGSNTEGEGEATESELGDIDVLEGSVSDDMITLDRFGENATSEEAAEPTEATAPAPAATASDDADDTDGDTPVSSEDEDSEADEEADSEG